MPKQMIISIGVFAHNEEDNIKKTIDSILKQKTELTKIKEIVVVSSGSYDNTNGIVRKYAKKDKRIKLIEELKRSGKSNAINLFLKKATSNNLIIVSADLRLHTKAVEEISLPFLHKDVGMVGAHPIPTNTQHSSVGEEIRLMWKLHHLVSMKDPKCGEMIAFRRVLNALPPDTAMDEATIEVMLKIVGFKVVYAPRAIVYNRGPLNFREFVVQRRRNYAGHAALAGKYHYQVSTNKVGNLRSVIIELIMKNPKEIIPLLKLILMENYARFLGWIDFHVLGKNPYMWEMISR